MEMQNSMLRGLEQESNQYTSQSKMENDLIWLTGF